MTRDFHRTKQGPRTIGYHTNAESKLYREERARRPGRSCGLNNPARHPLPRAREHSFTHSLTHSLHSLHDKNGNGTTTSNIRQRLILPYHTVPTSNTANMATVFPFARTYLAKRTTTAALQQPTTPCRARREVLPLVRCYLSAIAVLPQYHCGGITGCCGATAVLQQ